METWMTVIVVMFRMQVRLHIQAASEEAVTGKLVTALGRECGFTLQDSIKVVRNLSPVNPVVLDDGWFVTLISEDSADWRKSNRGDWMVG